MLGTTEFCVTTMLQKNIYVSLKSIHRSFYDISVGEHSKILKYCKTIFQKSEGSKIDIFMKIPTSITTVNK